MCNGRNHGDGCECGFGPPYPISVDPGPRESWEARSVQSQEEFRRGLRELGLDEGDIRRHMAVYTREGFPLGRGVWARMSEERKETVLDKLRRVLRRHHYEPVGEPLERSIKVPLFRLSSPPVTGSRATYTANVAYGTEHSWNLKIMGIGTGADQVFRATCTESFHADSGDCKMFFLPVVLLVTLLDVYSGKSLLHRALRVEPQAEQYDGVPGRGVGWCKGRRCYLSRRQLTGLQATACARGECVLKRDSERLQTWYLRDDKPGDPFKSSRSIEVERRGTRQLGYEVSAFGLQAKGRLAITRKVQLTVSFDLPGGHDYSLYGLKEIDGLAWQIGP